MKTIVTLDRANKPYGYPQLDGSGSLHVTGSLYGTASYALNGGGNIDTGSFATTGSNLFTDNQTIDAGSTDGFGSGTKYTNNGYAHYTAGISGSTFVIADTSANYYSTWAGANIKLQVGETDSALNTNLQIIGTETITGSNGVIMLSPTIGSPNYSIQEIHGNDDSPWIARFYNDTFSKTNSVMSYFGWNDGRFVFHNDSTQSIGLQVNGYSGENGLIVYEDKVAFVNNVEITESLFVSGGITGSLEGTSSWAVSASYYGGSVISSSYSSQSDNSTSSSYASTASYVQLAQTASHYDGSVISSSYASSASIAVTSSYTLTASLAPDYVLNNVTSSMLQLYVLNSQTSSMSVLSSSYAITASHYEGSVISSSYAFTASYYGGSVTSASYASSSSISVTASYALTASHYEGTVVSASYAISSSNSVSASYAATASYAPDYLPLTGGTINGNVTLNGTASIAYLNVQYESASVIYSSGSNKLGSIPSNTQTFYGQVIIPTGSLSVSGSTTITGSLNVTGGITGSLQGTSSYTTQALSSSYSITASYSNSSTSASYSLTASYIQNAQTASYILNAVSSSYASTASYVITAQTASYVTGSIFTNSNSAASASYSITASYVSGSIFTNSNLAASASYAIYAATAGNGGVTQIIAGAGVSISPGGGTGAVTVTSLGGSTYNTMTGSYGSFYDTGSYAIVSTAAAYSMSLSTTVISNGVYINGTDHTKIFFTNAGIYNLEFSAQFTNSNSQNQNIDIWIRQGNDGGSSTDLVDSNSIVTVPSKTGTVNGAVISAWNLFINAAANDYIQIMYAGSSTAITLATVASQTGPTVPRTPALIVTAQRVDTFLSNTGSFSGSFTGTLTGTASYASTASYVTTAQTASYILNAVSSSYSNTSISASYAAQALSSSYAITASYSNTSTTASYALNSTSASYSFTASYAQTAQTASYIVTAQTASYVLQAVSSSYSTTASYALNAGAGGITSISSPNSTITVGSPTTTPTVDINLANPNTWTGIQTLTNGTNLVSQNTIPSAPASGNLKIYSNNSLQLDELHAVPSVGPEFGLQKSLGQFRVSKLYPNLGGTQLVADGPDFLYADGSSNLFPGLGSVTINNITYDATNALPNLFTAKAASAASTNAQAGWYYASTAAFNGVLINNSNYIGGAKLIVTFGLSVYASTQRVLIGYNTNNNAAPTSTVDPSAFLNIIALGKDVSDTTFQFLTNNGSGTANKINTTITPNANNIYRLTINIPPAAQAATPLGVSMELETITKTGITLNTSGAITTKVPVAGTLLQPIIWANSGSGSASIAINLSQMVQERYI